MSNEVYPAASPATSPGLAWNIKRTPKFSTKIQTSTSGREVRIKQQTYSLDEWELVYSRLVEDTDLATIIGFYKRHSGPFDSFLLTIPSDSIATNQLLGIGDSQQIDFPLARTLGNYSEPVENCIVSSVIVGSFPLIPGSWSTQSFFGGFGNYLRLNIAPAAGEFVTATFTYSWRVRFKDDTLSFNNFLSKLWEAKSVPLMQVRGGANDVQLPPPPQTFVVSIQGHVDSFGDAHAFALAVARGTGASTGAATGVGVSSAAISSATSPGAGVATGSGTAFAIFQHTAAAAGTATGTGTATAITTGVVGVVFRQFQIPGVGYLITSGPRTYSVGQAYITETVPGVATNVGHATGTSTALAVGRSIATTGAGVATGAGVGGGRGASTALAAGTAAGISTSFTTSTVPPPQSNSTFPTRVVKDSLGINTHIDFPVSQAPGYASLPNTINAINYLGVKHIRDCPGNDVDVSGTRAWSVVAAATGAKFLAFIGETPLANANTQVARMTTLAGQGILWGIEGPNEWDTPYAISTAGVNGTMAAQMQRTTIWPKAIALNLPACNITFGGGWTATNNWIGDYATQGDLSPYCTYANPHTYPNVGSTQYSSISRLCDLAHMAASSRPVVQTELGWNNSQHTPANSALFALRSTFDNLLLGVVRSYFYALFDDGSGLFGMMNIDGVTPHPSGLAIHNLMAILDDPGVGANRQDAFSYTTTGQTVNDRFLTMEKSSGVFMVAIWNESDTNHNVTFHFSGAQTTLKFYTPLTSTTGQGTLSGASAITVSAGASLIIVEITP